MVVSLLLVRLSFLGSSQAGAQRWFEIAGFQVTPSEFAKIGLIVMLAASLSEIRHAPATVQDGQAVCDGLVPLVLVFIQPDIGTSIVMVAIVAGMFLVAGGAAARSRPSSRSASC